MREKALQDGYQIDRRYDCIDKASFAAVGEQKAKWEMANTPEAIAQRKVEWEKRAAEERSRSTAAVGQQKDAPRLPSFTLRHVDVNTATEVELANVPSVGSDVAAQIIKERAKRRFNDWADLVNRVVGLSAAQGAAFASISGLNVDGQSLPGVPPNPAMAAMLYEKYRDRR